MGVRRIPAALFAAALLVACDDGAGTPGAGPDAAPGADARVAGRDGGAPVPTADGAPTADARPAGDGSPPSDGAPPADGAPPLPGLAVTPTLAAPPADPLAGGPVESCPVYLESRCAAGRAQRCEVFDAPGGAFVDEPDPLLRRVLLYDRWYDLYHSPDGQTAERLFRGPTPGDLPEAEWAAPEHFAGWAGEGDSAIWTGVALTSDVFRYAVTGTQADYRRMEAKARALVAKFDVTGVPGYLARYHYLLMPPDGPTSDAHVLEHGDAPRSRRDLPVAPTALALLSEAYRTGVPDAQGRRVPGRPMWRGRPSIDQYTGPWVGLPLAWPLLRDQGLKARIVSHLTCYLKRLRRVEIVNLQQNPDLMAALTAYFGEGTLRRDPGDIDFFELDRLVAYVHEGINPANADTFDRTCPGGVALEPSRVIDAAAPGWAAEIARFARDLGEADPPNPGQLDHIYIPSIRGGDASHLIHMTTVAWWLTRDDRYRAFLFRELLGPVRAGEVLLTMEAFRNPDFCFRFYGDHITYGTHWYLTTLLRADPLGPLMVRAMHEELWEKALWNHRSAKFGVMYASTAGEAHPEVGAQAVAEAVAQLRAFGGNGGVLDAPRRAYSVEAATVIDALPPGIGVRCPTEEERTRCEAGVRLLGVQIDATRITRACEGRAGECVMSDGLCAEGIASEGLPSNLRRYADFAWQRSPFDLSESHSVDGYVQSPGRDLSEPYWMARHYGYIAEGADQVLAWRDVGACE